MKEAYLWAAWSQIPCGLQASSLGWRSYTLSGGPKSPQVLGSGLFLTTTVNSWYLNDCPHPQFSYLLLLQGGK